MLSTLLVPGTAGASGITLGRFGGIFGHPNADGGLSLYWNPARLSAETGAFFNLDGTLFIRVASFDRVIDEATAMEGELEVNQGEATTATVAVLPYGSAGLSYGFDRVNVALAVGFYPAYGGSQEWDKNPGAPAEFPGALDGPQRWSSIATRLMVLHYAGALSVTLPRLGLSLGFGVAFADGEIDTVRARNLNRSDDLVDRDGVLLEGRVHFEGTDEAVAFTAGASYDRDNIRASFTYRSACQLRFVGPARQAYATNEPTVVEAFIEMPLPHVFQTALTITLGKLILTGVTDYSTWSVMENNDALTNRTRERLLLIPRDLNNTFSARALVGWQFDEALSLSGMIGVDPSAVPEETNDASLSDALKFQLGLGVGYALERFRLLASYTHDIYTRVEVTDSRHQPPQNGTYADTRGLLNLSLEARF